jgi:hypothetical protein
VLSLILLYICLLVAGCSLASLLQLPTRVLQWTVALAAGCGQFILSLQLLSLFHLVRPRELLIVNALAAVILAGSAYRARLRGKKETSGTFPVGIKNLVAEVGRLQVLFSLFVLIAFVCGVVVAPVVFPATDPYHINMCLFWRQHESIQAFAVHDPRAVSVVFASEALALPGIIFADSPHGFVLFTVLGAVLCCWLIFALARSIGASVRVAFAVSLVFAASTSCAGSVWAAKSDFLLSAAWLLGSILFLFETRSHPQRAALLLGCSAFLFAMACGAKNTILLHAFAFGLALILVLGRKVLNPRFIGSMILFGFLGAVVSGVAWSYVQNQMWFGDWRGHSYLKETLARNYDLPAVWTRLCRGFVTVAYDCGWLPNSVQPYFSELTQKTVQALGGKSVLPEDDAFYSFASENIRPGGGMGVVGPLVLLPSMLAALWFLFRRRHEANTAESDRFRALIVFALVSFVTFYIVLRTQKIGVTRLMISCVAVAMPIAILVLRTRFGYWIGMTAAAFSLLLNTAHGVGFAVNRVDTGRFVWLKSLKRTPPGKVDVQWEGKPVESITIREPYTHRELYALVAEQIQNAGTVGLIGNFNAEGYFCFGLNYSNKVIILKDCRSDTIAPPAQDVRCVIVEGFDSRKIDPDLLRGFRQVFQASQEGIPVFTCYLRD